MTDLLNTTELSVGDTVHAYGMDILLDNAPTISQWKDDAYPVYRFSGLILNLAEVTEKGFVPLSFMEKDEFGARRWAVQGNKLATWNVTIG